MTKSGVEHDLIKSPYNILVDYPNGNSIVYYFSSIAGMTKFSEKLESNREFIKESLTNRFKIKFSISYDFCDVSLYRQVETRGYYIEINGVGVEWHAKLVYDGQEVCLLN